MSTERSRAEVAGPFGHPEGFPFPLGFWGVNEGIFGCRTEEKAASTCPPRGLMEVMLLIASIFGDASETKC